MKAVWALLFAVALVGISVPAVQAQTQVDPLIQIEDPPTFSPCGGAGEPLCFTGGTLTEAYGVPQDFVYCPSGVGSDCGTAPPFSDLFSMVLDITGAPLGVMWECQTDIWTDCTVGYDSADNIWIFSLFDTPANTPGTCNSNDGIAGPCPGFLVPGQEAFVTQTPLITDSPEPVSLILFGTGLAVFFSARKLRLARS
jgi:hypothetical protein